MSVPAHAATPSLVVDAATLAILHAEHAGDPWYPASTTKMMTAYVVFEHLESRKVTLGTKVAFSAHALNQESLRSGLREGHGMTLENALAAMLGISANDAAVALAETIAGSEQDFAPLMNDAAARLGMTASHFTNASGLFDPRQVTSARDLAILALAIEKKFPHYMHLFNISQIVMHDGTRDWAIPSRNQLLTQFPGTIGMKNGFVCASGRNMVGLSVQHGRRILAVVLGATTDTERNERTAKLLHEAFAHPPAPAKHLLAELPNTTEPPRDMRRLLCGKDAASYVRSQEKHYPMGLPGKRTYLTAPIAPKPYHITLWHN